jgi:hypothetical protein
LFDFLEHAGLVFGRWVRQAPYLPQCGALAAPPHASRLAMLPLPQQYAAVELFRGTMVRHSLIVYRDDHPNNSQPVRFDDERWQDFVPIRLPGTISVQQRLPSGAAAVLINQAHTYPDLIMPITAAEKRLVEAIDGKRTIDDIAPGAATIDSRRRPDPLGVFFERLWHYDQVVFDASAGLKSVAQEEA